MNAGQIYSLLILGSCINIWRTFTYVTEPTSNVYVLIQPDPISKNFARENSSQIVVTVGLILFHIILVVSTIYARPSGKDPYYWLREFSAQIFFQLFDSESWQSHFELIVVALPEPFS